MDGKLNTVQIHQNIALHPNFRSAASHSSTHLRPIRFKSHRNNKCKRRKWPASSAAQRDAPAQTTEALKLDIPLAPVGLNNRKKTFNCFSSFGKLLSAHQETIIMGGSPTASELYLRMTNRQPRNRQSETTCQHHRKK